MKQFLLLEGFLVAVGLFFFFRAFLGSKNQNHFRDDLWENIKDPAKREQAKIAHEDKVDKKILLDHKPDPAEPKEEKPASPEFKVPNFRGKPHEVLGVPANAPAEIISRAHKFWIKRYHPDRVTHLGATYVEQARRRAEQLNSARQLMLGQLSSKKV